MENQWKTIQKWWKSMENGWKIGRNVGSTERFCALLGYLSGAEVLFAMPQVQGGLAEDLGQAFLG